MCESNINCLPLVGPQMGTWRRTQARALTGNRTGDLSVCRTIPKSLSLTCQVKESPVARRACLSRLGDVSLAELEAAGPRVPCRGLQDRWDPARQAALPLQEWQNQMGSLASTYLSAPGGGTEGSN